MLARSTAHADFQRARRKAFWRQLGSWLVRADNALLAFEEVRKQLRAHARREGGMREVAIDQIVGSVGRYRDFDRAFLPRQLRTRDRWESIDLAHLARYRWYLGIEKKREIAYDEAVASWYDRVYLPTVEAIRHADALRDFPHRTEADLYLWITEHHWYLHEAGLPKGHDLEQIVTGYAAERSERPLKRLGRAIRWRDPSR